MERKLFFTTAMYLTHNFFFLRTPVKVKFELIVQFVTISMKDKESFGH